VVSPVLIVSVPDGMTMEQATEGIQACIKLGLLDCPHGFLLIPPGVSWESGLELDLDGNLKEIERG
jgi:hypothetical protein